MKSCCTKIASVVLFVLLAVPVRAFAHAFVDHAEPRVGSDTQKPPGKIKVWFTQKLEPAFSKIQVVDAAGKEVDQKDSHVDADDRSLIVVSLPTLSVGTYKVVWQVVSTDTHHTHGDFKFTVKP